MVEKLDLEAIGNLYGYKPPELEPVQPLGIDWKSVSAKVEDRLECVFLELVLPKETSPYLVDEKLESELGPLTLQVTSVLNGRRKFNLNIHLSGFRKEPFEVAHFLFEHVDGASWQNAHREVAPEFRRQGIARQFLNFAEVCAVTQGFQSGQPHQISAEPYQLDVLNMFLAAGYEPGDPEKLECIRRGDKDLCITTSDGRPWTLSKKKENGPWGSQLNLFRVPVLKRV